MEKSNNNFKFGKRLVKSALFLLLIPVLYLLVALVLSSISVNPQMEDAEKTIYLSTNGVHLDIVMHKNNLDSLLLSGLYQEPSDQYFSFGWGDEDFYLNTPTWGDLTLKTALNALFLNSSTLMHVTRHSSARSHWVEVSVTEAALDSLNAYLQNSFATSNQGKVVLLENKGYTSRDDFYTANGNYTCFNTCNTWVNNAFKTSGLRACLWTPFDFGLLNKYR